MSAGAASAATEVLHLAEPFLGGEGGAHHLDALLHVVAGSRSPRQVDVDGPAEPPLAAVPVFHADGLCSRIYRARLTDDGCTYALKVVVLEDQVRPHDVLREVRRLRALNDASGRHEGAKYIIRLLAAVMHRVDPFTTEVHLVLPFHACTLAQLQSEAALHPAVLASSRDRFEMSVREALDGARPASRPLQILFGDLLDASTETQEPDSRTPRSAASLLVDWVTHGVAAQLLSGLTFVHSQGIAHRDIKPSNVLLAECRAQGATRTRHDIQVRLVDFGTAWDAGSSCAASPTQSDAPSRRRLAARTTDVGTSAYRAPELLFAPTHGYDAYKCDVWAACCTLAAFFTEMREAAKPKTERAVPMGNEGGTVRLGPEEDTAEEDVEDEIPEWQRALEADDGCDAWRNLRVDDVDHAPGLGVDARGRDNSDEEQEEETEEEYSETGWIRQTLFDGNHGDLALAGSIFDLLGLPDAERGIEIWPESLEFRPPLARMPFLRKPPAPEGILKRLPLLGCLIDAELIADEGGIVSQVAVEGRHEKEESSSGARKKARLGSEARSSQARSTARVLLTMLESGLQLSASRRPTAHEALQSLRYGSGGEAGEAMSRG